MQDENQNLVSWVSRTRNWVELAVLLGTLLLGAVFPIYQLKQEVALLKQKVDILVGNHEKRITTIEAEQKIINDRVGKIEILNERK